MEGVAIAYLSAQAAIAGAPCDCQLLICTIYNCIYMHVQMHQLNNCNGTGSDPGTHLSFKKFSFNEFEV